MQIMEYIDNYIQNIDYNKPIFNENVYDYVCKNIKELDRKKFNTYLTRYEKKNKELVRYGKGIYYKEKETIFGTTKIDEHALLVAQYLKCDDEIFGYETGPSLFNKLGLTTQMSNDIYIVTNNNRKKINKDFKNVILIRPVDHIDKYNYKYYQFLDILNNKYKVNIETDCYYDILKNYIDKYQLNFKDLLKYSLNYKNNELYKKIALLAREVE